jgi:ribosomal protein S12 methylthiotransferase accessory factor
MNVGIAGDGPAAEAAAAAFADVDATVQDCGPADLGEVAVGVVVAPAGADAFDAADGSADRWAAVEIGGVGGHAVPDLDASVALFGPESAQYADLRTRVAATTSSTGEPSGDRSTVRLAGAVAGRRTVAWLAGDDLAGTAVELSGTDPWVERRALPVPGAERDRDLRRDFREASLEDAVDRAERAQDDRVGLLTQVGERESFPVPYYIAATADTAAYSDARAAEFAAGVAAGWDEAFMKALGEGLERYSAGVYRTAGFDTAPGRERATAVTPDEFVRPADAPAYDPDRPIHWVRGEHLATGATVSLPAEFVHYPPPEERYKPAITTGLGLGNSGVESLLSGLYEVIERDATMLAWYSTFEPLGLSVEAESFRTLVGRARSEELTVTPLLVTADVDLPIVACAVHRDGAWPRFAVGSGADLDPGAAATSALAEALQNWTELRAMGPERADSEEGAIGAYADFPPAARDYVETETSVPAASVGPETVPTGADELVAVVERVVDAGLDPYAARITPPDVAELGFEAVRVLVPSAQPLFTGDPYFGDRAESVPPDLGFGSRLDRDYHPYP